MIISIHDELIFEVEDELLEKEKDSPTVKDIKSIMEKAFELRVPLRVDAKIGKRWGEMR